MTHWGQEGLEMQRPHRQWSSLGIPAASALGSSEPGEVPAVALHGQNKKLAAASRLKLLPGTLCMKCSANPCLGAAGGAGRAPRALSHSCLLKGFQAVHFYQDILLI